VILYLDTSSLAKLYLEEPHCDLIQEWVEVADLVATSQAAYPETLSAFTRRRSRGDLNDQDWEIACQQFALDWPSFVCIPVNEIRAGSHVLRHQLRGFDAVHLAAACDLLDRFPSIEIVFSSFDANLLEAAQAAGFSILHPTVRQGFIMDSPLFSWASTRR
jgi:predicted nucleic acid-binding protein